MKVFYCKNFTGIWPVGVCAIVVAKDETHARSMLRTRLKKDKLDQEKDWKPELIQVYTDFPNATIVNDGDY